MKKVKLFTTIASLCLAVALMAFGVYAATSAAKAYVNGTVSFDATVSYVELSKVQYKVENGKVNGTTEVTTLTDLTMEDADDASDDLHSKEGAIGNVVITDIDADCVITVEATFINKSNHVAVNLDATPSANVTEGGYTVTAAKSGNGELAANEAGNTTKTVTVTFTIKVVDKTQSVDNIAYNVAFTANPVNG